MASRDESRLGPSLYNGVDRGVAFQMMASMGWKEGTGLGANEQGMKEHLKVKKKFDKMGMGAAEQVDRARDWTTGMWTYDRVLSGLKEITAQHSDPSSSESSGSGSDGVAPAAKAVPVLKAALANGKTVVALKARKAAANGKTAPPPTQAAPLAKPSGSKLVQGSPPMSSSGSESDSEESSSSGSDVEVSKPSAASRPTAASANRGRATHAGRYHKRESAKLVKGYSANDLAAILGSAPTQGKAAPGPGSRGITAGKAPSNEDSEGSSDASSSSGSDSEAEGQAALQGAAPSKAVLSGKEPGGPEAKAWWIGLFVRSGRVGGTAGSKGKRSKAEPALTGLAAKEAEDKRIRVTGFREQDQENLYTSAQNNATHGKQGLGVGSAPKKVAGAHWCGTKVKVGSDSDSEEVADVGHDSSDDVGLSDDSNAEEMAAGKGQITILGPKAKQLPASKAAPAAPLPGPPPPPPSPPPPPPPSPQLAAVPTAGGKTNKRKATEQAQQEAPPQPKKQKKPKAVAVEVQPVQEQEAPPPAKKQKKASKKAASVEVQPGVPEPVEAQPAAGKQEAKKQKKQTKHK